MLILLELQFFFFNISCGHPKYMTVGLNSCLGLQSICFMGFWISYYGWSYARQALICLFFLTPFTLPHRITLFAFFEYLLYFPSILSSFFQPPFPLPISYLQLNISGWAMITLDNQWAWGSNSIISKWLLRWEWEKWHWNCFPPQKICLAATFPRQCRVVEERILNQLPLCPRYNQLNRTQVIKHDECRPKLFTQWALGWPEAWAYGPGGPRAWPWTKGLWSQAVLLGQGLGPKQA